LKQAKLQSFGPQAIDELTVNLRNDLNNKILGEMVRSYARGDVRARMETGRPIELGGTEAEAQLRTLAEYLRPIQDYNAKFAETLGDIVKGSIAMGDSPIQMKREIAKSTVKLMREPITIQREGKKAVTYTPEAYAHMLSTTIPYSLRNRAYVEHYKKMGVADGWVSVVAEDEKACEFCLAKAAESMLKPFSWNDPLPSYHPHCRCRPQPHFPDDLPEEEKPGQDVTEEDKQAIIKPVPPEEMRIDPIIDINDAIQIIRSDFPVSVSKEVVSGAVAQFRSTSTSGQIQLTPRVMELGKPGTGHLLHEYVHGIDWGKDERHTTSQYPYQLMKLFPQFDNNQMLLMHQTELKDTMSYMRFACNFYDERMSSRPLTSLDIRTYRVNGIPEKIDFIELRDAYLARADEAIKAGRWAGVYENRWRGVVSDEKIKETPELEKFLQTTRLLSDGEWNKLDEVGTPEAKELGQQLYMANRLLPDSLGGYVSTDKQISVMNAATGVTETVDEIITPFNLQKYLVGIEDPIKRHDVETGIVLRYLIHGEKNGNFTGRPEWSEKATERLAEFVRFVYTDPARAKEIAPHVYKAFMENLATGLYGEGLKKLLGVVV